MSWIDNTTTKLIIKTGDGKEYRPLWLNASKDIEYNIAEFEFPNLQGTLVKRGQAKGTKFALEIYFQGEDHLAQGLAFEQSSNDPRAWVIAHPVYGEITVHPVSLNFDYTKYNVSKVTGTIIETIVDDSPKVTTVPVDIISMGKVSTDATAAAVFAAGPAPTVAVKTMLSTNTAAAYAKSATKAKSGIESEDYFNLFNKANAAIVQATEYPLNAIGAVQQVLTAPGSFAVDVKTRMQLLSDSFDEMAGSVATIVTRGEKMAFENNAGALISTMCLAASTPQAGNYSASTGVYAVLDLLLAAYNNYIVYLDQLQSVNGGQQDSYVPDNAAQTAIGELVRYTISNLFNIALNAKQERSIYLEEDSNVILLAHRFYGLTSDDSTIDDIISNNQIGLSEILGIQKGRKIIYYI